MTAGAAARPDQAAERAARRSIKTCTAAAEVASDAKPMCMRSAPL